MHTVTSLLKDKTKYITSLGVGFLVVLIITSFLGELSESSYETSTVLFGIFAIVFGVVIGKFLAVHVSVCDHVHLDNTKDFSFLLVVCLTSLGHTIVDGSVLWSTWSLSVSAGVFALLAIMGHEIFRTGVLFSVLRAMGFPKWVSGLSVFGISIAGLLIGFILGGFLNLDSYEGFVHILSIFFYTIVVTDVFIFLKKHYGGIAYSFLFLGAIIGLVVELVISVH
jgi:hypothetical protein